MSSTQIRPELQCLLKYINKRLLSLFFFSVFYVFLYLLSILTLFFFFRVQIYCLSDLHADYKANFDWISNLPSKKNQETIFSILICSGDITHDISRLGDIFHILKLKYDEVYL